VTAAAYRVLALQFAEFPVFPGVIGKFVVRESGARSDVSSHGENLHRLDARRRIMAHPVSGLYHKEANAIPARNVDAN
jgi:hypothetical protein